MASHGVPRTSRSGAGEPKPEEVRSRELERIQQYRHLETLVSQKIREGERTPEVLKITSKLLKLNPEYYTIWNDRRLILQTLFKSDNTTGQDQSLLDQRQQERLRLIREDLEFIFPLLVEFPKCYWIWNHRLWLLNQATSLLPSSTARQLWQEELGLVGKMLGRDSRNFHGWGYRRMVVANLENPALAAGSQATDSGASSALQCSMAEQELEYTTKMIKADLSNFSAWHNRTKLIIRFLNERAASDSERKTMLDQELELIHSALFDPYDQSLWFYHQNLMCTFDPTVAAESIAPNLSDSDRIQYLSTEIEFIHELLDGADDCKWIYQALIECTMLEYSIRGNIPEEDRKLLSDWLIELKELDPLRKGRWQDLEKSLDF